MAIGNFGQLKTAVASWLHRTDLTSAIPDFVSLCESDIKRDLRLREMEASTSVALTSTTLALPDGFLEVRRVRIGEEWQQLVSPVAFNPLRDESDSVYTVIGTNFVFQESSGTADIDYYKSFAAFSDDGDTNWLLTNHPDVYLFGTLAWAQTYIMTPPTFRAQYNQSVANVRNLQRNSLGPLTVRSDLAHTP